jgi:subtilisin family serine protease
MLGQNYLASFSSAGPTFDQRAKPDILAPGMYIGSVRAWSDHIGECDDTDVDVRLYKAGTSMAAPIVSGTAALIRQYFEQAWYPGGSPGSGVVMNPSSALVKAVLINGAQAIDGIQSRNGTTKASTEYDNYQQFGRINLITSLPLSEKNNINALVVDRESISNNQEDTYHITITSSGGCQEPLSASLVWTDPPGRETKPL